MCVCVQVDNGVSVVLFSFELLLLSLVGWLNFFFVAKRSWRESRCVCSRGQVVHCVYMNTCCKKTHHICIHTLSSPPPPPLSVSVESISALQSPDKLLLSSGSCQSQTISTKTCIQHLQIRSDSTLKKVIFRSFRSKVKLKITYNIPPNSHPNESKSFGVKL